MDNLDKLKRIRSLTEHQDESYGIRMGQIMFIIDELIKEAEPFDPYSLKVDDEVWVWNDDKEEKCKRRFAVYLPEGRTKFVCFSNGYAQSKAMKTVEWKHCELVEKSLSEATHGDERQWTGGANRQGADK